MREVRWGILGTGRIAGVFAAELGRVAGARLVSVCSRSMDNAHKFEAEFGAGRAFDDIEAFLADESLDAVYVATPNSLHAEQTLLAIAAGKAVLTEKPLALARRDAQRVADAAARGGTFVMEGMWTRFLPAIEAVRRQVAAGAIGEIRKITADLSYFRDETTDGRFFDPALGGGAAFDLGVYAVSLTVHLLGMPQAVSGRWRRAASGVDMRTWITMAYPSATAELSCGFDRDGANFFLIEGTQGALKINAPFLKAQRITHYARRAARTPLGRHFRHDAGPMSKILDRVPFLGGSVESLPFQGSGLQFQVKAVMEALRQGATANPLMPLAETVAVIGILEAVLAGEPNAAT